MDQDKRGGIVRPGNTEDTGLVGHDGQRGRVRWNCARQISS